MKREYSLALGERTAEEVKVQLASAWPLEEELYAEVRGRDLVTGLPKTIVLSTVEIREAVEEPTASIVDAVKVTLDKTPPELAADIMEQGIVITGGGSQLIGIDERDPGRDRHAGAPGEAPAVLGGPRFGSVPRELRRAAAGPELLAPGLTAPEGRASTVVVYRHDRRRRLTLVLLVITSLALISLDERGSAVINSARTAAQDVVSPLQSLADDVINPVTDWFDGLGRADELQAENERLRAQLDRARSEIAAAKGSLAELTELRADPRPPDHRRLHRRHRRVVSQGTGNFNRTFEIAKGSGSGIAKGMPVVVGDSNGAALVGEVTSVSRSRAIVRRIDDRNFGVGAQVVQGEGFGPKGTASGQANSGLLRFSVIEDSALPTPLKQGDIAVTLGLPTERFPSDLVIGRVVREVGAGGAINRDAELRPVVDLDALNFVKVLKYPPVPVP